ncbi:hypothetical protein AB1Y20_021748 [Prymnesium parvum]|uniref:Uncharacterized protein n=1 Tax=Prymnesium parvum TaxID=97485 RepID=A0AB34JJ58_PRYPA
MAGRGTAPRLLGLSFLLLACAQARRVTIDNTQPRRTTDGRLMDVHDGNIVQWQRGGRYFWYGMGYQNCTERTGWIPPFQCPGIYQPFGACGFRTDHALHVYSSADLVTWSFEGDALPAHTRPRGVYFRPKVVYNQRTAEFVLWINLLYEASATQTPLAAYPNATYLVAVSAAPAGPFRVVQPSAFLQARGAGDLSILVDGDEAYVAYDAWSNGHRVKVEKLDDRFYNAVASPSTPTLTPSSNEAPVLFKRNGWYYLLYGHTCCFCKGGAGAHVMVASHPLANWTDMKIDLNPRKPWSLSEHVIPSQNNYVFTAQVLKASAEAIEYVFTADLWSSAADHLKSHDRQFWAPLSFDDTVTPPSISLLSWINSFQLNLTEPSRANV